MVFTDPRASLDQGSFGDETVQNRFEFNTAARETKCTARQPLPDGVTL